MATLYRAPLDAVDGPGLFHHVGHVGDDRHRFARPYMGGHAGNAGRALPAGHLSDLDRADALPGAPQPAMIFSLAVSLAAA